MSVYPFALDSDETIIRIDDNITELGGDAINQLRDAVFAIEGELGIGLKGSLNDLADRLAVSLNTNGTIKQSALAAVGLVTLPIVDNQVASNAGIKEYKLALDHKTSDLYTIITANKDLLDAVNAFASTTNTNFLNHLAGSTFLADGETSARHVASHIDLNAIPSDPRDPFFTWTGLKDKNGSVRTATQVAAALLQINDDLTSHENSVANAHVAEAISVDTSGFQEIPVTANTVQKVIDYIERAEELNIGEHRAVQHANGIPAVARSQSLTEADGYGRDVVVPTTTVNAFLVNPPANSPVDSNTVGDDIIKFKPTNTDFVFDSQFSQVKVGDILRINYGNGIAASFEVESTRFTPGVEWIVRVNGVNLANAVDGLVDGYAGTATARIDRPQYDSNTYGVLALASANSIPSSLYPTLLGSVIVGHPRGATALGLGFDGNKLNSSHYKLWLQLYPTGNPADNVVNLPFIDVTGDAGASPGSYTLEKVVHATNDAFRKVGYNYRFIAFEYKGDFGIMLADPINKASFAIVNGSNATGTIVTDIYTQNVVADASDGDGVDAFGFGSTATEIASPAYQATWIDSTAAQHPTKVLTPVKRRFYIVDGRKLDNFAPTFMANSDGYWPATIEGKVSTGSSVEVTYKVNFDLRAAKLKPGKTIVVQPSVALTSGDYSINDYGRFIIKQVVFSEPCGAVGAFTTITVINGVHANGSAIAFTSDPGLPVHLYFSEDSVGFDDLHIIDGGVSGVNYHRFHEIYINRNGVTFSHERARMKDNQAEASPPTSLLRSDFWHIKAVSPKLRGYRDNTTSFNKYIRFYVTRYDSTSGEFDGYIGRRNPLNNSISQGGPVITSRKNVTTRFYDETYVDYVELEFKELAIGPTGTAILSDTNPRYVDIELFPSMRLDDENMLIGSCEVNWDPPSGQNIVQAVKDLRDFGSIGPNNFNTAAVEFISAGDRALHENGVVRGFQYVPSGATNTTGELFFTGGMALVNGKIVTTNNSSVTIPTISDEGATGVTVTWAICVNEFGYLQPIILTAVKDQFFAAVGALYYVPSVTFDELVNNRKDLTLVATVDAHIASITINDSDIHDLRRFVGNEGYDHPLVLHSNQFVGNFHSFDAVKQWINKINGAGEGVGSGGSNLVRVRGAWNLTTSIDLTGFNFPVIFEGDGTIITTTAPKGVLIGSNVTLRNINFVYKPIGVYSGKVSSGAGCVYGLLDSGHMSHVTIEDCTFTQSTVVFNRPPFISFQIQQGRLLNDIQIKRNSFSDPSASTAMAAVAIVHDLLGASSVPPAVANMYIEDNTCDGDQGIYVTTLTTSSEFLTGLGLNIFNGHIRGNKCGKIGVIGGVAPTSFSEFKVPHLVTISNNTCKFIGGLEGSSGAIPVLSTAPTFGIGNMLVESNSCHWIHVLAQDLIASNQTIDLRIVNNALTGNDNTYLDDLTGDGTVNDVAIKVMNGYGVAQTNSCIISGNQINQGRYTSTTYTYFLGGISVESSAVITNNIIRGLGQGLFGALASGIIVKPGIGGNIGAKHHLIQGNAIYRFAQTIEAYINVDDTTSSDTGVCVDNFFDSTTIDGSSIVLVKSAPNGWLVERNKNQTVAQVFHARQGVWSIATVICGNISPGTSTITNSVVFPYITDYNYDNAPSGENIAWKIPLAGNIPNGVTITGLEATVSTTALSSTRQLVLTVATPTGGNTQAWNLTTSPVLYQLPISGVYVNRPASSGSFVPEAIMNFSTTHTTTLEVTIDSFTIYYKW